MSGKARLYSGLNSAEGPLLSLHRIRGQGGIGRVVTQIRQQIVAGDVVFFEDNCCEANGGVPIVGVEVARRLNLQQLARRHHLDYEVLKTRFVCFSSTRMGHYTFIDLFDRAQTGDEDRIGTLPANHPFEIIANLTRKILHPIPGEWSMGAPDEDTGPGDEFFAAVARGEATVSI